MDPMGTEEACDSDLQEGKVLPWPRTTGLELGEAFQEHTGRVSGRWGSIRQWAGD